MKSLVLAIALLTVAAPVSANSGLPADLAVTQDAFYQLVPAQTTFTHAYTVTNLGTAPGVAQVWDAFSYYYVVVELPPECRIYTAMLMRRLQQAGVWCDLGTLEPGQSVHVSMTLKTKFLGQGYATVVNRNRNVQTETTYENNSAFWYIHIPCLKDPCMVVL